MKLGQLLNPEMCVYAALLLGCAGTVCFALGHKTLALILWMPYLLFACTVLLVGLVSVLYGAWRRGRSV